jgi:hypothetical protein
MPAGPQGGSVFRFNMHPATIGIADGIQIALDYLRASWRRWLPVVVVIAACTFLVYALIGTADASNLYYTDPNTHQTVVNQTAFNTYIGKLVPASLAVGLVGLVGGWIFTATAISGLRNRPLTSAVVVRGIVAVAASILLLLAAFPLMLVTLLAVTIIPPLLLAAIPVWIYLYIRVVFYTLAVFDGYGPIEGIRESWRLSHGAMVRMFGWGLMAILISIGLSLVALVVSVPFASARTGALGQAVSSAISTTGSCFSVFLMAVLYESQRARYDPMSYPFAAGPANPWGFPGGPYPYAPGPYPPGPYGQVGYPQGPYPYPPAPYPAAPYPAGPYPAGPTPYAPMPYPAEPAPYPAEPAPYPVAPYPAGPAWPSPTGVPPAPDTSQGAAPTPDTKPTDQTSSS